MKCESKSDFGLSKLFIYQRELDLLGRMRSTHMAVVELAENSDFNKPNVKAHRYSKFMGQNDILRREM
jgi:hypothetical protein